jgi:5-methylthioadenosine/S-adenosylhomocysteine deaminase
MLPSCKRALTALAALLLLAALAFAAEPVDLIVAAGHVVTMDASRRVIEDGAVAVRGSRIVGVASRAEIAKRFKAKSRIDEPKAILIPGLINTHTHAPMVLLRGIADDLRLQDWLEKFIFPAEAKNVSPDFVRWGTRLACAEMMLSGTTTYADMYYFEDVIAEATKECGMRGILGQTVIGFPVADAKTPDGALQRTELFLQRFRDDELITPAIAPHAVYTNSDETLKAARALANKYRAPFLIHLSETRSENEELFSKRKLTPTKLLESLGALEGRTLVAHGVWVDAEDMRLLKERGVGVAHCPSSNTKLASGIAPVLAYLKSDIAIGLGTDGPAGSNNDLNLFEEMDLAAKMQKVTAMDPVALTAQQAFEMATLRGARAVGLEKEIGSLEEGKRADLVIVQADAPHAVPMFNVYSQLVYALKGSDVRHVIINGRVLVRNGRVLSLDMPMVLKKAEEYRKAVAASLKSPASAPAAGR